MNEPDHWDVAARILIALFASIPSTLMATAALLAALRAYRQSQKTFIHVDSRMNQLLEEAKSRARLEGNLEAQAAISGVIPPARGGQDPLREHYLGPRPDLPPPPGTTDRPR